MNIILYVHTDTPHKELDKQYQMKNKPEGMAD